jgi:cytochrome c
MRSVAIGAMLGLAICFAPFIPAEAQNAGDGKGLLEKRCAGCHALDRDKEGPRLGGVYGRAAGTVESFSYSDALKKSGLTWNDEALEKWLEDTGRLVPGNDMDFRVVNPEERRGIISYLKAISAR